MTRRTAVPTAAAAALLSLLAACGGGGSTPTQPVATPTPAPAATVTATGAGAVVVHPSLDARFGVALETPIRVTETTGGTADWNFARISYFRSGRELERYELGSDVIRAAGFSRIAARSNQVYTVVFRGNSSNFDRLDITLGFGDLKDARQFTAAVDFGTFTDVSFSPASLGLPSGGTIRLARP